MLKSSLSDFVPMGEKLGDIGNVCIVSWAMHFETSKLQQPFLIPKELIVCHHIQMMMLLITYSLHSKADIVGCIVFCEINQHTTGPG